MRRRTLSMIALSLVAAGCAPSPAHSGTATTVGSCEASAQSIKIATGNAGGVYHALGGALAKLISGNTRITATSAETGASVQNIQELTAGKYDVAFSLADTAADAVAGTGAFAGGPQKIQALTRIYPNYTQVVVRKDAGIDDIAGMRGKRISTGSPKSGTEVVANRLLKAAGLNPDTDVQAAHLGLAETATGMADGSLDGLIWSGGLPTTQLADLTKSLKGKVKFLDVLPLLDGLKKISPVYDDGVIPAATYGQPADIPTIVVPNMLLVREDFPAPSACAITTLIFTRGEELEKAHPAAKDITMDKAPQTDPVPLHPGSKRALGD
ncbi:C4-dicarboxylate ABC transporter substrate-binding protein [Lentzea sp. NBRC 105346]|uniref:TAXI family TRAP transporter solute-binding subunit n=1 Tax=Lentzea sp. NBRC 105346 TaxID=3032205 RepID=UPI0024A40C70|nr:TAXI family TRAP transporter solute-binding subunit [Lentzea sp. NBRC 105346]GLZ35084.1 C4-dicarboxylate ABC transporter substrate-binding protein [Lentzea sp. NBRC 105346]